MEIGTNDAVTTPYNRDGQGHAAMLNSYYYFDSWLQSVVFGVIGTGKITW